MQAGTKVLLTNLTEKNIEDVVVGDALMGMVRDAVVTKIDTITYSGVLHGLNDQTPWIPDFHPVGINVRRYDEDIFPWARGNTVGEYLTEWSAKSRTGMRELTSAPLFDPNMYNQYTSYEIVSSYAHPASDRRDEYAHKDDPAFDAAKFSAWETRNHEYELRVFDIYVTTTAPCENITCYLLSFGPGTEDNGPLGPLGTFDIPKDGSDLLIEPESLWGAFFANKILVQGLYSE